MFLTGEDLDHFLGGDLYLNSFEEEVEHGKELVEFLLVKVGGEAGQLDGFCGVKFPNPGKVGGVLAGADHEEEPEASGHEQEATDELEPLGKTKMHHDDYWVKCDPWPTFLGARGLGKVPLYFCEGSGQDGGK